MANHIKYLYPTWEEVVNKFKELGSMQLVAKYYQIPFHSFYQHYYRKGKIIKKHLMEQI